MLPPEGVKLHAVQELKRLRREIRRLQQQESRDKKRQKMCGLPDRLVSVVVATYVLSDWDLPLAEAVGRMLREKMAVPGASKKGAAAVPVETWCLDAPPDVGRPCHFPATPA